MGAEMNSSSAPGTTSGATSSTSPVRSGKRSRDTEDEVYLDNFHSHKRYLSEIMASSLNGLTVGDPLPDSLLDSPARSEPMSYSREEMSWQYSPMSDDSDDSRGYETSINTCSSQPESVPTSPVSPCRYQRPLNGYHYVTPTTSYPSHGCTSPAVTSAQPRQRGSDSEGRLPSSPSDICHSADLRRAALLRSVQMRTHPAGPLPYEMPFNQNQEPGHSIEAEDRQVPYMKSLIDEREYQIEDCSLSISEPENQEKSRKMLHMSPKGDRL